MRSQYSFSLIRCTQRPIPLITSKNKSITKRKTYLYTLDYPPSFTTTACLLCSTSPSSFSVYLLLFGYIKSIICVGDIASCDTLTNMHHQLVTTIATKQMCGRAQSHTPSAYLYIYKLFSYKKRGSTSNKCLIYILYFMGAFLGGTTACERF